MLHAPALQIGLKTGESQDYLRNSKTFGEAKGGSGGHLAYKRECHESHTDKGKVVVQYNTADGDRDDRRSRQ
jgi:hypothetical protein